MSIRMEMRHRPSGLPTAHGKWQSTDSLWKYNARRKARKVAKASRRRNRRG